LNNNQITRFESARSLENLENLCIEQNGIKSGEILVDLAKNIKLESLRILKNPMSDIHSTRHVRNIAVGEIATLKVVNGTELSRYDRRDYEIYYLNHAFKEYFNLFNTSHEEYYESEFMKWAEKSHPNVLVFIQLYENPFPQIKDKNILQENSMNINYSKETMFGAPKAEFCSVFVSTYFGPLYGKRITKRFARSTDLLYIRSWMGQYFKIKDMSHVDIKFKVRPTDVFETVNFNEMTKDLSYFGIISGTEMIIEPKEDPKANQMQAQETASENLKLDENGQIESN